MLDQKTVDKITAVAAASSLMQHNWTSRGRAPAGYIKGMAVCFGHVYAKLLAGDSAAKAMVRIVEDGKDVFDQYEDEFNEAEMPTNDEPDDARLRSLFVVLTGLGMRESSGRYCEGRDRSASNTRADTAEAGLFQQSWDSRRASPEIVKLFNQPGDASFLDIFKEGVKPRNGDLDNYGTGDGRAFQAMCKVSPAFAVQVAAIGLRTLYTHWGPIIRHEVELVPEADDLFQQVQDIIGEFPTEGSVVMTGNWFTRLISFISGLFHSPPVKPPVSTELVWVHWASKEVGFHELGQNRGIDVYIRLAHCGSDGDPWCAIFVNAALEISGIRGTRSAMARSFEHDSNFVRLDGPALGAVTTMWRGSPDSGTGHVFFYLGENERGILALGGNQSDQVCQQYEPRNRVVGYFWPKSVPLPKTGAISIASNANEGTET